jgi:hypothetical protein
MRHEERGDRARLLLEDELMAEAFSALDAHYVRAWRDARTTEAREDAHRYVTLLEKFKAHLKSLVTTGEMTKRAVKELEGRKTFW